MVIFSGVRLTNYYALSCSHDQNQLLTFDKLFDFCNTLQKKAVIKLYRHPVADMCNITPNSVSHEYA